MIERRLASLLTTLALVTPLAHAAPQDPAPERTPVVTPRLDPGDLALRRDLRDDHRPGNARRAYRSLHLRGAAARPALVDGLQAIDWQERLLCAVLLAQQPPHQADQDLMIRVLIAHLADNEIRADASLAANALLVVGEPARAYLKASAWHAPPQLADLCKRLRLTIQSPLNRDAAAEHARTQLTHLLNDLRWVGRGDALAPAPVASLPDLAEATRRAVVDLGQDDIRGNANRALAHLSGAAQWVWVEDPDGRGNFRKQLRPLDERLRSERTALHAALSDPDRQRRQLAGYVLMDTEELPTDALLDVAIQALQVDEFGSYRTAQIPNAGTAMVWLEENVEHTGPRLLLALRDPSEAVRIRAASVLARGRHPQQAAYVPLLIEHLADNDIEDDATVCGKSLALMGPEVLPWLDRLPVDAQQAHYFDVIRRTVRLLEADPEARMPFSYGRAYGLERRKRR